MRRRPLTPWARWSAFALLGMAAVQLVTVLVLKEGYPLEALVFELPLVVLAALVVTGRVWATTVAAAVGGLLLVATAIGQTSVLGRPRDAEFLSVWVFLVLALAVVVAGVGEAASHRRQTG